MMPLTKIPKPKTKQFFYCKVRRLAESFKGLKSSLVQLAEDLLQLLRHVKTAWFWLIFMYDIFVR